MKNILFLTLASVESIDSRGIYSDLINALGSKGHRVYVVTCRQKRMGLPTGLEERGNISILKVRTGNITKTGLIEKCVSTLTIERQYEKAIQTYFQDVKFEMIMYSTPPITFENLVGRLKRKHKAKTYLILKDIFPQNAVDMGFVKKRGLIWRYFRKREENLYKISDHIGCMSAANKKYIIEHNPNIDANKVEIFPNAIIPKERFEKTAGPAVRKKYNIPEDAVLFVYGGNLGRPQGIDFLLEIISNFHRVGNSFLLIVGSGTEYGKIEKHIQEIKPKNVNLLNRLPKEEYDQLMSVTDVGLIFLDHRFTIPNFPSRLTAYMEASLPIIAATDVNTDLKDVLQESCSGFWSESGDLEMFLANSIRLAEDQNLGLEMGLNGRKYLEENYDVTKTVDILLKHL